jgi:hypothetical protein
MWRRLLSGVIDHERHPVSTGFGEQMSTGSDGHDQDQYVVAKALEVLASDPRLGETSLHVTRAGNKLFVTGDVPTPERREMITKVLEESFPDREIDNATSVYDMIETGEEERL